MGVIFDFVGQHFGRLLVKAKHPEKKQQHVQWVCFCDPERGGCGKTAIVTTGNLRRGTQSCGCLIREAIRKAKVTHGLTKTTEYRIWRGIVQRCCNPNHDHYDKYGGRGITICNEWRDNFMEFLADMGPRPSADHTIDRKDNDKGYYKDNCRWATLIEQNNNKTNNCRYLFDGEIKTLTEWCRELDVSYVKMKHLLVKKKMNFEDALDMVIRLSKSPQ